jgi:hypothetical protein
MTGIRLHLLKKLSFAAALVAAAATLMPAAGERTFSSPQEAAQALIDAADKNDTEALLKLFGPEGRTIVVSGDPAEDKNGRADFARLAHQGMHIDQQHANRAIIEVGPDHWPFPVPLVRKGEQWMFDSAQGKIEVLARRVGRNELNAIEVCRGYVEAQMEYAARDRDADGILEYAQSIVSAPGKKDGLYWEGESDTLVPKSFADAAAVMLAAKGKKAQPYHGYFFHILKSQGPDAEGGAMSYVVKGEMIGGFALVAWPAEYGVSGVNTLIVNQSGTVYEKDLGPATGLLARQMTQFNPGKGWQKVTGE